MGVGKCEYVNSYVCVYSLGAIIVASVLRNFFFILEGVGHLSDISNSRISLQVLTKLVPSHISMEEKTDTGKVHGL